MYYKSAYWQIKIDEESIPLTAFSAPQGHYEWIVMTFSLKNISKIFQRRMDNNIKYLNYFNLVYIDDILVFSTPIEKQKDDFVAIIQRCIDHNIVLCESKRTYAQQEIEF